MRQLATRIIVGAVLIALIGLLLWLDGYLEKCGWPALGSSRALVGLPLAVLVMLLVAAACVELSKLAAAAGMPISLRTGLACAVIIGTLPFWRQAVAVGPKYGDAGTQLILGGVVMLLFVEQLLRHRTDGAVRRIAGSLLAVCYLGVCSAIILGIRIRFGLRAFILFLAVVKATDIGAYFTGTFLGRHKLVPWLSAGKTWEGLFGGLALGAVCGVAIGGRFGPWSWTIGQGSMAWWSAAVFAILLGLFGQGADLCESALKRDAGLKDSGRSVPAFGGILDVVDSPLLSAPVAYVLLAMLWT